MHESFAATILQIKWNKETNVDVMAGLTQHEEGILCEKIKQYPVVWRTTQRVQYREKDIVTNTWNAVAKK